MTSGLLVFLALPETPAEHARNALTLLRCLEEQDPVFYASAPELERAARRTGAAISFLERAQSPLAIPHLHAAVDALAEAPDAWDFSPTVPAACARLLHAYFGALNDGRRLS